MAQSQEWNLPPREGGDTYLEPLNTVPAGQQPIPAPPAPEAEREADAPLADEDEQRAMRLLQRLN